MGRRIHGPLTEPARSDQVNVIFLEGKGDGMDMRIRVDGRGKKRREGMEEKGGERKRSKGKG